jgi:coenzyme F420-reducing hydrogenase beta subunit
LSLTGLATHDMDTDGIVTEFITDEQAKEILDIIEKKGIDAGKFLVYMSVDTIGEIEKSDYEKAIKALKIAKGKAA